MGTHVRHIPTSASTPVKGRHLDIALPQWVAVVQLHRDDGPLPPLLPEEEALIEPRAVASREADIRLGRAAARQGLAELGQEVVPILRGAHREPLWPDGVVGSITHADGLAVAAVAPRDRCVGIGIDLERRERFFPGLVEQVAFGDERRRLEALPAAELASAAVAVFSAKEVIYKALFPLVGEFFGFEAARVTPNGDGGFTAEVVESVLGGATLARPLRIEARWHDGLLFSSLVATPDDVV